MISIRQLREFIKDLPDDNQIMVYQGNLYTFSFSFKNISAYEWMENETVAVEDE